MFAGLFQFYRHNRRKIVTTMGTLTACYFLIRYILNRRREAFEYQQYLIRQKIKKKYLQTQQDCIFTIVGLLPTLSKGIYSLEPVEDITKKLISKRKKKGENATNTTGSLTTGTEISVGGTVFDTSESKPEAESPDNNSKSTNEVSKQHLWNDLKVKALARLLTSVYSYCLLVILVRLQLNLLARKDYLETAMEAANIEVEDLVGDRGHVEYVVEQSYLALSWWLVNHGYVTIYKKCTEAIKLVFKDVNARTEVTFNEFSTLIAKTQELIDKSFLVNNEDFIEQCILPPENKEFEVVSRHRADILGNDNDDVNISAEEIIAHENFRVLIRETRDYINTDALNIVLVNMVTSSIGKFLNNCSDILFEENQDDDDLNAEKIELQLITYRIKLVKILSIIMKENNKICEASNTNEYVQVMSSVPELEEYTASVYSNFSI
ncbi:Pex3 protein [Saccharomycopsis crataegensis]|uniref:Peroxin-3 n=1 Tax=Saccharomycopsis crataegensis TaxID=43959 RepID=A0AAV5QRZ3_9ASCO|nr:Pex3 protein [Saccharomycopsis crataegensis]